MDFFAWLKAPKPEVNSQIEQKDEVSEIVTEEPIDVSTSDSNEVIEQEEPEKVEGKPVFNLDLIDKFIQSNPQITRPKKEFFNPENMAKRSEVIDLEFVSETLANIYYEQGNYDLALKAYEKLSLQNPSKQAYFADLIEKIRIERK
jgi:tetratricopeptide (TPR) repeat protein